MGRTGYSIHDAVYGRKRHPDDRPYSTLDVCDERTGNCRHICHIDTLVYCVRSISLTRMPYIRFFPFHVRIGAS